MGREMREQYATKVPNRMQNGDVAVQALLKKKNSISGLDMNLYRALSAQKSTN